MSAAQIQSLVALTLTLGEPLCQAEQMELVHVECQREPQGRVLRLYIDKAGGVKLDDCVNISRQIGDLLDVHFDQECAYNLEVTSPGPNRPLARPADFERIKGQRVRVSVDPPLAANRRRINGVLEGLAETDKVAILSGTQRVEVPLADIKRAHLVYYQGDN